MTMQRLLLVGLLLLLGACAQQSRLPIADWDARQSRLENIDHWQLTGKLGVRVPGDNGSANLRWQQRDQHYQLDLSGPLGSRRMIITGEPGRVTLQESGQPGYSATSAEALLVEHTGWALPVSQLVYWIRALPAPGHRITHWAQDDRQQLSELEQAGWRLSYTQYQLIDHPGGSLTLPGRVVAEKEDIRLTLVIRDWQLEPLP